MIPNGHPEIYTSLTDAARAMAARMRGFFPSIRVSHDAGAGASGNPGCRSRLAPALKNTGGPVRQAFFHRWIIVGWTS